MMKRFFLISICCLSYIWSMANNYIDTSENNWTFGMMHQWRTHSAYSVINEVVATKKKVYALSTHSLFSVDKLTEEIEYHSRLTGLNSSNIDHIYYNQVLDEVLLCYQNGHIDIIDANDNIYNISDLYLKQTNLSKQINDIHMYQSKAFLAMSFGIICLNLTKHEIEDTYYIGENATEVHVKYITIQGDSIYAASDDLLYSAHLNDNLMDYKYWHTSTLPSGTTLEGMCAHENRICVIRNNALWSRANGKWQEHYSEYSLRGLCQTPNHFFVLPKEIYGALEVQSDFSLQMGIPYGYVLGVAESHGEYWLATQSNGLVRSKNNNYQEFKPNGPLNNIAYRMQFFGDRLYVVSGGRWATQNMTYGEIMFYENGQWTNITNGQLTDMAGHALYDFMNVAQDPNDKNHYFVTSYGTGLVEMYNEELIKLHLPYNSVLQSAAENNPDLYTRTDGAMFDDQGNLWVLNAGDNLHNIKILSNNNWYSFNLYSNRQRIRLETPGEILVDRRNSQWKWIPLCRYNTGIVLLKDNGTPTNPNDDQTMYHNQWLDQNGQPVMPEFIYCIAQDQDDIIWVGTSSGVFTIPPTIDFMQSNQCERIIINRNDGTNLADYLLGNEQINCIVIDGANRKWIGTAASGIFLLSEDGKETVEHFTTENSLLPSDNVLSIAIQESTGEVFIGTSRGLVSYMSDAVKPEADFNNLYAYPNPVYPNYKGSVVIKGLMNHSEIRIIDASGNLVKVIQGNGGEAIWDITNTIGQRVASGIYTIICNTLDGKANGHAKVMIMN